MLKSVRIPLIVVRWAAIIHDGVKLDNLIQIAHNVEIGGHTAIAANVGISGSTKVGLLHGRGLFLAGV